MKKLIFLSIIIVLELNLKSQTNYSGTSLSGSSPSAIGINTKGLGNASFASGFASEANGYYTTALGFYSMANYTKAISIGTAVKANAYKSITIGSGFFNSNVYLQNNTAESLIIGFKSKYPTLGVTMPEDQDEEYTKTGRVAIGNLLNESGQLSPLQKFHLKADEEEIAAMFIEPYNWEGGSGGTSGGSITESIEEVSLYENGAYLLLGNSNHGVGAVSDLGLLFNTETNFIFNEGNVGINTAEPGYNLHVNGSLFTSEFTLYNDHNIPGSGYVLVSDEEGNGYWVDPSANGVGLWKVNEDDANDIYYNSGNVGIGTIETYDYRLAVNGKILTDEVMVKHYDTWPDFVFEPEYKLMPLKEVEAFVKANKHLPNVKSQEEVEDGYGLSEMNTILLQKIEELTLYVIKQEKEMKSQMELIEAQQEMIKTQQEDIKKIKEHLTEK